MDENLSVIEEMAKKMADEIMSEFNYIEQNQVWLLIKHRLLADREAHELEAKTAKQELKRLR